MQIYCMHIFNVWSCRLFATYCERLLRSRTISTVSLGLAAPG